MGEFQPWHIMVVAVVAFLLFGARRLPELGKGLGEGLKGFREGLKGVTEVSATPAAPAQPAPAAQQSAPVAPASAAAPTEQPK